MNDRHKRWTVNGSTPPRIRRRDLIAGGLLAGVSLMTGSKAWAQAGPTVPLHCVPPLPPGQAVRFSPAAGPLRVRKSVFDLDATEIARLRNAYSELRKLAQQSPDDPRNWYYQGLMHCWYCTGALDSLNGMEIHGGWWFLGWHRAYLYFHERVLGTLIGDPTFALPYWDWDSCVDDPNDTTGRNRFPGDVYGFPGSTTNPLYDSTRAVGPNDRIPTFFVGPTVMKPIMKAASFTDFGGSGNQELPVFADTSGDPQQMGLLEGAPHGGVHVWTTDPKAFSGLPDMGSLASAAFDPVFFAHHANIDRLWDVWTQDATHANPSNVRWTDQAFYFYDQAKAWTEILTSQMINPEGPLSYRYQPPNWPTTATVVAAATTPRIVARAAESTPLGRPVIEFSAEATSKVLTAQPTTLRAQVSDLVRTQMSTLTASKTLVLRVDGVELPADRGAVIQVFLNRPDAKPTRGPEPGYVGSIVIVPATAPGALHLHKSVYRNFGFPLTPELTATLSGQDGPSVTLVPVTGDAKPAEVLRYRRVYIAPR